MKDETGKRLVAFGQFAGNAGKILNTFFFLKKRCVLIV
jgi:hypothetical protein